MPLILEILARLPRGSVAPGSLDRHLLRDIGLEHLYRPPVGPPDPVLECRR